MRGRLALYKNPRTYEFTDIAFRDESGKVRRSQLVADRTPLVDPTGESREQVFRSANDCTILL
jgi:hypothetical protein